MRLPLSVVKYSLAMNRRNHCSTTVLAFILGFVVSKLFSNLQSTNSSSPSAKDSVDWSQIDAETMTARQIVNYFGWTNSSACRLTHDFGGVTLSPPSGLDGQKAICLDPPVAPIVDKCLVYSFGIDDEWSFDEAMEEYGCRVFALDPSMRKRDHNHTAFIHFFQTGLSDKDNDAGFNNWKMRTLSSIYEMLKPRHGDVPIDYLKIDIEMAEWDVIPQIIASGMLSKVRQMGIEIHLHPPDSPIEKYRKLVGIIQSIERQGMVRFDSKLNPWSHSYFPAYGFRDFTAYEIAWYNSHLYDPSLTYKLDIDNKKT